MENLILMVVGLLAAGYIGKVIWKGLRGESECHCSSDCASNCHKQKNKEQQAILCHNTGGEIAHLYYIVLPAKTNCFFLLDINQLFVYNM